MLRFRFSLVLVGLLCASGMTFLHSERLWPLKSLKRFGSRWTNPDWSGKHRTFALREPEHPLPLIRDDVASL
jgi:hypothetical protein